MDPRPTAIAPGRYYQYSGKQHANPKIPTNFPTVAQHHIDVPKIQRGASFHKTRGFHTMKKAKTSNSPKLSRKTTYATMTNNSSKTSSKTSSKSNPNAYFGITLQKLMARQDQKTLEVPTIISSIVEYLKKNECHLQTGLFRIPGSKQTVEDISNSYDMGRPIDLLSIEDHNVICSLLTFFLRELPEPVLTFTYYPKWISVTSSQDEDIKFRGIWALLRQIPKENFQVAKYLMKYFAFVSQFSETNKMTTANMAAVIRSTFLRPAEESVKTMFNEMPLCLTLLDLMIQHYPYFFEESTSQGVNHGADEVEEDPIEEEEEEEGPENPVTVETDVPEEGLWARAVYPYVAQGDDELEFEEGDLILLTEKDSESDWWPAIFNEVEGIVPINYLEILPASEIPS